MDNKSKTSPRKAGFASRRKALSKYVKELKEEGSCKMCSEEDIACLEFHHTGSKRDNISDLVRRAVTLSVLKREIAKCVIVCANCHKKIHYYGL